MAFVASVGAIISGSGSFTVPKITDVAGNTPTTNLYSHGNVSAGAANVSINFDGGANRVFAGINRDVCFALPPDVRVVNVTGDCIISLGKMD
jgi:hypothetical protein